MYFLGYTFFSHTHSMDATMIGAPDFTVVSISNSTFDDIFIGEDINMNTNELEWNFDTIFWAKFQDNLSAGNVTEKLSEISSVLIKRRTAGKNTWIPLFELPIDSEDDLKFAVYDRYVANNQQYQYALVFMLNDEEGSYNINEITPDFNGIFIVDKNAIFSSTLDPMVDSTRNHSKAVVSTIDKKYPFVITQSSNDYDVGTVSAVFAQLNEQSCQFDFENAHKYRNDLKDFLNSGSTKFIKVDDGRIWMAVVTDAVSDVHEIHTKKVTTSFGFTEVGGVEDLNDLADNDFIVGERI